MTRLGSGLKSYRWCWGVLSIIPSKNIESPKHYFFGDWDFPYGSDCALRDFPKIHIFSTPHGFHGIDTKKELSLKELLFFQRFNNCDPKYADMTEKRGYATLEFKSKEEANFWRYRSCVLVKFQRVETAKEDD